MDDESIHEVTNKLEESHSRDVKLKDTIMTLLSIERISKVMENKQLQVEINNLWD